MPLRFSVPSGAASKDAIKVTVSENQVSLEIIMTSSPFALDAAATQSNLSKKTSICEDNHPKMMGHYEYFENLRAKESDAIFLKSAITLLLLVKTKIEKLRRQKNLGTCITEADLLTNKESDHVDDAGS